jgi:hypothetical protein
LKNASSILTDIEYRLQGVRRKQNRIDLLSNACIFLTGVVITVTVLIITEILFELSHVERTAISVLFVFSFLGIGSWIIGRPVLHLIGMRSSMTEESTAYRIGAFFPAIRDRLLNALQLAKNAASNSAIYSAEMIDESLRSFAEEIQSLDFSQSVDTSRIPLRRRWLLISAGVSFLVSCLFPISFSGAAYRLIHCTREFAPPPKYLFKVTPGNKEIVKGENVPIQFKVTSLLPAFPLRSAEITIYRQQEGQENYDELKVKPDSIGTYNTTFQTLRTTT